MVLVEIVEVLVVDLVTAMVVETGVVTLGKKPINGKNQVEPPLHNQVPQYLPEEVHYQKSQVQVRLQL